MRSANEWGETIPEPGATLTNHRVNPANLAIEAKRRESRLLSKREFRRSVKRRDVLYQHLTRTGFWVAYDRFQYLMNMQRNYTDALAHAQNGSREPLEAEQKAGAIEINRLRQQYAAEIPMFREWRALCEKLELHGYAVERAAYDQKVNEELAKEAGHFKELIIERWAALGFKHDRLDKRGRRIVHKVSFSAIHISGDAIWYKIAVAQKTLSKNFKGVLPYNVRVAQLISAETLLELSLACQRQVTAHSNNNGAWVKVNRLDSVDGLLTRVDYDQVMKHYPDSDRAYLPIPFGVEEGRRISWVHLTKYPHVLIGGTTGGGKSNLMNVVICTLLSKHGPDEVQIALIDLKEGLEFTRYNKLPHLFEDVVTSIEGASELLLKLEGERARRGLMLAKAGMRDIDDYNRSAVAHRQPRMPHLIVFFDEYAAIYNPYKLDYQKSIMASVMQLTNKARAAGIHLILCTQTPEVGVVPGNIKNNMSFRIAAPMPTQAASMTILGVGDAATLPHVPGRMMAMAGSEKWPLQTPLINVDTDIPLAIKQSKTYAERNMDVESVRVVLPEAKGSLGFGEDDLLVMVMEDYNGYMKYIEIWTAIKDQDLVSQDVLRDMIAKLKEQKEFEYQGEMYRWKRLRGNITKAVPVNSRQPALVGADEDEDETGEYEQ